MNSDQIALHCHKRDIGFILDLGIQKQAFFSYDYFAPSMQTVRISRTEALRREALLDGPGIVYRFYSEQVFLNEMKHSSMLDMQSLFLH